MAIDVSGIVDDSFEELWIFDKEVPIKWHIALLPVFVSSFILSWLSMSNEEKIMLLAMVVHLIKE